MWLNIILITFALLFWLLKKNYNYWKDKGVPGPDPVFFFGNIGSALIGKKSMAELYTEIYRKYEGYPFVGFYRMFSPCLMIRDPELIKNVTVKDFKHFQNNDIILEKEIDRLFGRNPFVLKGSEWKAKRAQLTPCFSSAKIKAMYSMLETVSKRMVKFIEEKSSNEAACLESREVCVRFTLDNVAACTFGLEAHCFDEDNSLFRKLADDFLSPGTFQSIKVTILMAVPSLGKFLKAKFVRREVEDQIIQLVQETLKERQKSNIVRNDFLESISTLYKDDLVEVSAQAATFFADGYETSSRTMSFVLFELARHPKCQRKLREEINKQCEKFDGNLTYDIIQEMPYLDACINESMRINPLVGQLFKTCTEQYTYTSTNPEYKNLTVKIEPDTSICLPVTGLQLDEKFFKSPDEYIPERFLDKSSINKYCFLPFGEGPRACLGMRFGLTQVKIGVAQIVKNFEMTVNEKTKLPLKYDKWFMMLCPLDGLWINFKRIKED